jgi:serine/threonine protein kinase
LKKHFLVLQKEDLYCYNDHTKVLLRFMHSMIGCHVVGCNGEKLPCLDSSQADPEGNGQVHAGTDLVNDTLYFVLTIKLSEKFKRIFYFPEKEERDLWYLRIKKATHEKPEVTDKYIFGPKIGEGSFGKVFSAQSILTQEKVAIKFVEKKGLRKDEIEQQINEIEILRAACLANHPNILKLLDYFEDANSFYLVTEWMDFTYLDFVTSNPNLKER